MIALGGVPVEGVATDPIRQVLLVGGVEVPWKAVKAATWNLPPRQWAEATLKLAKESR